MTNNYAFIDAQNVHLSIKRLGWELDWKRFRIMLLEKYHVTQAYVFIGKIPGNAKLYDYLLMSGFQLIYKEVVRQKDGSYKGNVDAELVLHSAAVEYQNYEKAIIVSGDGDFACLLEYLHKNKKLAKIIVPDEKRYSALLKKFSTSSDNFLQFLNRSRMKIEKQ